MRKMIAALAASAMFVSSTAAFAEEAALPAAAPADVHQAQTPPAGAVVGTTFWSGGTLFVVVAIVAGVAVVAVANSTSASGT